MEKQHNPGPLPGHDSADRGCPPDHCDPNAPPAPAGPVREPGGTTGAGNLSPGGASRTGGATTGVPVRHDHPARDRNVPPDA